MFDISKYGKEKELQIISSFDSKNSLLNEINAFGYIKHTKDAILLEILSLSNCFGNILLLIGKINQAKKIRKLKV